MQKMDRRSVVLAVLAVVGLSSNSVALKIQVSMPQGKSEAGRLFSYSFLQENCLSIIF